MQDNKRNKPSFQQKGKPTLRKSNRPKSTLNPKLLVQSAVLPTEVKVKEVTTLFSEMEITAALKSNIEAIGFKSPTPIQDETFTNLVNGRNLIGIANTGTGKTGAFLIPIMERLMRNPNEKFQTLIIVPTRELAVQVNDEFKKLAQGLRLRSAVFIGGTNVERDARSLEAVNFDFIIGTPGRLLDLKNRGNLKLNKIDVLILDEFDKMLDMGFVRDIQSIAGAMRSRNQTLLFSATKDNKQQRIIEDLVTDPFIVEVSTGDKSSKNVEQDVIYIKEGDNKFEVLTNLLNDKEYSKVILFTETKHLANRLSKQLIAAGISSDQIHGNKSQNYRLAALDKFKSGVIRVLVATDVAARGIDVNNVSLVVNYQLPMDFDTYIHRVGRTGRAGKTGKAYTFVD